MDTKLGRTKEECIQQGNDWKEDGTCIEVSVPEWCSRKGFMDMGQCIKKVDYIPPYKYNQIIRKYPKHRDTAQERILKEFGLDVEHGGDNYSDFITKLRMWDVLKETHPEIIFQGEEGSENIDNIKINLPKATLFEITEDVKRLLSLTDAPQKNSEIHLPYDSIFLDVQFTPEELKSYGIEVDGKLGGLLLTKGDVFKGGEMVGNDLRMSILSYTIRDGKPSIEFNTFFRNVNFSEEYVKEKLSDLSPELITIAKKTFGIYSDNQELTPEEIDKITKWSREYLNKKQAIRQEKIPQAKPYENFIHNFALNFINLVNNPDVEDIYVRRTRANDHRVRQGEPIPDSHKIVLTGHLKRYVDNIVSNPNFHYSHRFWVRGHFREFHAPRYKAAWGQRRWILPFIKGSGMLVEKVYQVK
jgi:hypothetical protein